MAEFAKCCLFFLHYLNAYVKKRRAKRARMKGAGFPLIIPLKFGLFSLQALFSVKRKHISFFPFGRSAALLLCCSFLKWGFTWGVCTSYCYGLIPLCPQVTMSIHSILLQLQMFLRSVIRFLSFHIAQWHFLSLTICLAYKQSRPDSEDALHLHSTALQHNKHLKNDFPRPNAILISFQFIFLSVFAAHTLTLVHSHCWLPSSCF